jgi:hypothetical protein
VLLASSRSGRWLEMPSRRDGRYLVAGLETGIQGLVAMVGHVLFSLAHKFHISIMESLKHC